MATGVSVGKTSKLSLKIIYDRKSKKVLFAEAEKEAVDFLFYILSLPLTTVTRLLSKSEIGMVGCLNNLLQSVSNLDKFYFLDGKNRDLLLNPLYSLSVQAPLLPPDNTNRTFYTIYKCPRHNIYSINSMTKCLHCLCIINNPLEEKIVAPDGQGSGFVKGLDKYTVMDNLVVKPISPISSIFSLKEYFINVKDLGNVDEIVVDLGLEEGLKILKASLEGESVITSAFLDKLV